MSEKQKRVKVPPTTQEGKDAIERFLMAFGEMSENEIDRLEGVLERVVRWAQPQLEYHRHVIQAIKNMLVVNEKMNTKEELNEKYGRTGD